MPFKKGNKYRFKKGNTLRFKKGHPPWNKGKPYPRMIGNDFAKGSGPNKTSFKKGQKPPKHRSGCKCIRCSQETRIKLGFKKGHSIGKRFGVNGYNKGENHHNFKGWKSKEPYGLEFNKQLREQIRQRDNFRCQQCFRHQSELFTKTGKHYKLLIHHIDFDKKNNIPENLISLCRNCHGQTNYNREDWTNYFQDKIKEVG